MKLPFKMPFTVPAKKQGGPVRFEWGGYVDAYPGSDADKNEEWKKNEKD